MSNLRRNFRSEMATSLLNEIQRSQAKYYYFLGKVEPWGNDTEPDAAPINSETNDSIIRNGAIFARRIAPADVSLTTRNIPWQTGKVFDLWDSTIDMKDKDFYCVTAEFNVYKCLDNNGGVASTIRPTSTLSSAQRLEDGYLWKYMYTIPSFKVSKFFTGNNLPVQRALSDSFYSRGAIDAVVINDSGTGYGSTLQTSINVSNSTLTGSGATVSYTLGLLGEFTSVSVVTPGSGYTAGAKLRITSTTGAGAILSPTFVGGELTSVSIISAGVGYIISNTTVTVSVGGAVVVPQVSSITGRIVGISIVDEGAGYASPPALTVSSATGSGTGILNGNVSALVEAKLNGGSIKHVSIIDPGINYPVASSTQITVSGDGIGATFTPVIYNGSIIDVVVESGGSGYTSATLTVTGPGTGANLSATISQSDYASEQAVIEQTAIPGGIHAVIVDNGGSSYSSQTEVTIEGDGSGCIVTAYYNDQRQLIKITVNEPGSNYTYANVVIYDPVGGSGAVAHASISPTNGHGSDAVSELYADKIGMSSVIRKDALPSTFTQDFRNFGILKNPRNVLTNKIYETSDALILFDVNVNDTSTMVVDEILILNDTYKYRVIEKISSTQVYLQAFTNRQIMPIGTLKAETNATRQYTSSVVNYVPRFNKYSGALLYVSNEPPFIINNEQGLNLKTFIKF